MSYRWESSVSWQVCPLICARGHYRSRYRPSPYFEQAHEQTCPLFRYFCSTYNSKFVCEYVYSLSHTTVKLVNIQYCHPIRPENIFTTEIKKKKSIVFPLNTNKNI